MRRTEQLKFCKICKNQEFDSNKGIVCNRTGELADFTGECTYFQEDVEKSAKAKDVKEKIRDNSKRAKLAINVFIGICFINVVAVISGYFEVDLLEGIAAGRNYSDSEINSNDIRQGIVGLTQSVFYICSIVFFLNWFRRAYWNLHQLSEQEPEFDDTMAVWGFVIPFVNLYRPLKIAKEIVLGLKQKLTDLNSNFVLSVKSSTLGLWWGLFLITNYVGQFAVKSLFKDDTIEQLITSSQAYLVSDSIDIIAAIFTAIMIKQISQGESKIFEHYDVVSVSSKRKMMEE